MSPSPILEHGHHPIRTPDDVHVERGILVVVALRERHAELGGAPGFEPEPFESLRLPAASVDSWADRVNYGIRTDHQARENHRHEPPVRWLCRHNLHLGRIATSFLLAGETKFLRDK